MDPDLNKCLESIIKLIKHKRATGRTQRNAVSLARVFVVMDTYC